MHVANTLFLFSGVHVANALFYDSVRVFCNLRTTSSKYNEQRLSGVHVANALE